jgi:hypothetical protein
MSYYDSPWPLRSAKNLPQPEQSSAAVRDQPMFTEPMFVFDETVSSSEPLRAEEIAGREA